MAALIAAYVARHLSALVGFFSRGEICRTLKAIEGMGKAPGCFGYANILVRILEHLSRRLVRFWTSNSRPFLWNCFHLVA